MPKKNLKKEEFWNTLTHGIGAALSVVALVLLIIFSVYNGSAIHLITSLVFGGSLVLLYSASTSYHAAVKLKWKRRFLLIDHLSIYVLIAGTYTPIALLGLKGIWGWTIFGLIWGFVVIGFIFKFSPLRRLDKLSLLLYVLMGWLIIIAIKPLLANIPSPALWYLLAGGLSYMLGIYFYVKEKVPYYHAVWHIFVLGGSTLHFLAIFLYLIP
ncbi:hemolysin III family protein [Flavobacterium salilacus subsp. salilacus]|uniref:PAQR family membrane homeostasis protein TrhA n=1 Tax=Flavobacterium TaxID=237 RepID=UPI001074AF49|nr:MULTISPECIES: hemolysin III family protein [Flavobacterium]KAF2516258.1 hemolysin III family protein [Flavobacterium salilacus subsp. salilacus]MBE1613786.1 hemolysin III family protein [Flavobacterium sp. SaA2.13]